VPRKKTPVDTEKQVLVDSRRRCALCFGLNNDFKEKKGQIGHANHNSEDNRLVNLVWLCFEHHIQFDSTSSQAKNYTRKELLEYRKRLYNYISSRENTNENKMWSTINKRLKKIEKTIDQLSGGQTHSSFSDIHMKEYPQNKSSNITQDKPPETSYHADTHEVIKNKFSSYKWITPLRNLCYRFLENLQKRPSGQFLHFREELLGTNEEPGRLIFEYYKAVQEFKKTFNIQFINLHKIASFYISLFLKYELFYFDSHNSNKYEHCLLTEFPNEYFSLVFLSMIFEVSNDKDDKKQVMTGSDELDFIKLLYRNKKNIDKFDPLTFSYIISLIEKLYFKPIKSD
jgi:TolA-binding protein